MFKKFIYILIIPNSSIGLFAQEPKFTQFYAAPLYLNPAFIGLTYMHLFTANYLNQWPGIKTAFTTYMATYDYNVSNMNSGIGGFILQDRYSTSNLVTTMGGVNYAYCVKVGKYSECRGGVSLVMNQMEIDNTKLIFNHKFITGSSVSQDALALDKVSYFDIGLGALFNSINYWIGFSGRHLNQPNESMVCNIERSTISGCIHGGYRYIITARGSGKTKLEEFVSASFNNRHEQKYDQLDIGAYYFKSFVNVGLWYRGLPVKKYKPGYPNRESLALLVESEIPDKNFRVGYSYDATISNLKINNT